MEEASQLIQVFESINQDYKKIVQALPVAVCTCDANGYIVQYNDAAVRLWGRVPAHDERWTGAQLIFNTDGTPLSPKDSPTATALRRGEPVSEQYLIERPDGSRRIVLPHLHMLKDESGNVTGVVNILIDVTDQRANAQRAGHMAAIVESSDDAIISKTLNGIVTSWNASAQRVFGYTADEMIGESITKLIPADRADEEPKILSLLGAGKRVDHFETKRVTKYGVLLDVSLTISPIRDEHGKIIGISKIARDITAQKAAQRTLLEREAYLQLAAEGTGIAYWDLDVITDKIYHSPRLAEIFGYDKEIILSHPEMLQHIDDDDRKNILEPALERAFTKGVYEYEVRLHTKDGVTKWIKNQGIVTHDENGKAQRIIGTMIDITQQKQAQQALEKLVEDRTRELLVANRNLELSNEKLEQYAFVTSHDLQEPLRKIQTFSNMLADRNADQLTDDGKKYIEKIIDAAKRMSRLISDLLNFSRLDHDKADFKNTDLNVVVDNVCDDLELLILQKGAEVTADKLPALPAIPLQMHQLFYNLLNNALKFSSPGRSPVISITSRRLAAADTGGVGELAPAEVYYEIVVKDNGIGFDQKYAHRVFEIFQRLNNRSEYEGTGIGLALCNKIVTNHGGVIFVRSKEGEGTEFHILLPEQAARNSA